MRNRGGLVFVQRVTAVIAIAAGLATGCSGAGSFVWGHQVDPAKLFTRDAEYRIQHGEMLSVRVFNQDGLSTHTRVRSDGRIDIPLAGEVLVVGKRPADLAREVEERLKPFVVSPDVAISIEESLPTVVSVVGEVARSGVVSLDGAAGAGVLQALAAAGGLTEYADRDSVFVLRKSFPHRIRFTYDGLTKKLGTRFQLHSGDVVVVE
ncbi:MAG: polysaccharide biosynthesis/export family protein [Polyangiaceae bacterium]|nr:polysaccharide biosynthesis/export family protein [Polyangiaceae bacterium]